MPTASEWTYICDDRTPDSGVRYVKAKVNGVSGLMLLPEDWNTSYYTLSYTNDGSMAYNVNTISLSDWTTYLEAHGAIFLPLTGYRQGTGLASYGDNDGYARYWSSTSGDAGSACNILVKPGSVTPANWGSRSRGYGVRLVKEVAAAPKGKWLRAKGSAQALVEAGSSSTGTMLYSLDNSSWSSAIPTATAVGNYTVYYKIQGDANHEDFTPNSNSVQATIFVEDGWVDSWQSDSVVVRTNAFDLTGKTATILTNDVERATGLTTTATDAGYWRIAAELNSYAGQELRIVFYNNTTPVCFIDTIVPYVVSSNTTLSNYTAFPTGEHIDVQVVSDTLTFNVGYQIGTLDVYAGAKVVVTSSHDLGVDAIVMRADAIHDRYSRLVANAAITDNTTPTDPVRIYYDYTLDYAQFYTLAVPFDVNCADIRTKSGKAASYEVQWYDGAERAKNTEAWTVLDDQAPSATLHAGQGYAVFGVPYKWNGTRQQTTVLRFPMGGDFEYGEAQKSVSVSAYSTSGTAPSNRNWNLIGNPYLTRFKHGDNNARLMIGHYTPDGSDPSVEHYTYVEDDVRYITYSTDGYQTYTQARATTTEMLPFHAYFIQAASTGTLTFTVDGGRRENAPRRLTANGGSQERALGIVLRSTDSEDATGLLYGEAFTNGYDMNADLVKLFGSAQGMSVYTLAGGEERAFNALAAAEAETAVAVGFRFAPVGQPLTFALDEEQYDLGQLEAVLLTDHATHTTVDLLSQPYVFTTAKAQDNTRFSISVRWRQEVPTGIENGQTTNDGFVQVYDLLGRPVTYDDPPAGVYIILENGQSRKEVIR